VRGTEEKVKNDNRFGFSGMTGEREYFTRFSGSEN
jgi:hypothetical protein